MQYSVGSCRVQNGSSIVYRNGAVNWAGIVAGALFGVQGEGIFYPVLQYITPDRLILTAPYRGTTNAAALYVVVNDFTPNMRLPKVNKGDLETATIFDYAMNKLESTFAGSPGDMFKSIYDTNNNGIVDAAETVPWTGIQAPPALFPPIIHGLQHLDNGSDPIPLSTYSRSGLMARLSGVPTQYFNGIGGFSDPTSMLNGNIMLKSVYDANNNGVVDTCDLLDWSKITNPPTTYSPSAHGPSHLDTGSDPIPPASTTHMGLMGVLPGNALQFANGVGGFSIPTGQPLTIKGTVATAPADLPSTGAAGQIYVANDTQHAWAWNGSAWIDIGQISAGPQGAVGPAGIQGLPAYTKTTVPFTVPPVGQLVVLQVQDTSWMATGENVYAQGAGAGGTAGVLQVFAKNATAVTLLNPVPSTGIAGPPGATGAQGIPGLVWKGIWAAGHTYHPGDGVSYGGDSYIAINQNVGDAPPSTNWQALATGTVWFNGHGPPVNVPGANPGDYYLDVDAGVSYLLS